MGSQLELDLDSTEKPPNKGRREGPKRSLSERVDGLGAALLYWAPAWVPCIVIFQLIAYGLLPALDERERLEAAEADVRAREEALLLDATELERHERMLADDMYRARVRRSLSVPGSAPLLLSNEDESSDDSDS